MSASRGEHPALKYVMELDWMIEVRPSQAQGKVRAPPSKSYSHRALAISLLCEGPSKIENISRARDVIATLNAIRSFGAKISDEQIELKIKPPQRPSIPDDVIDCGGSGTHYQVLCSYFNAHRRWLYCAHGER